jgi:hypothetical protein
MTLACPMCGELEATFNLDLANLQVTCESCSDTCTAEHARDVIAAHLARWQAVVELVETASKAFAQVVNDEAEHKRIVAA